MLGPGPHYVQQFGGGHRRGIPTGRELLTKSRRLCGTRILGLGSKVCLCLLASPTLPPGLIAELVALAEDGSMLTAKGAELDALLVGEVSHDFKVLEAIDLELRSIDLRNFLVRVGVLLHRLNRLTSLVRFRRCLRLPREERADTPSDCGDALPAPLRQLVGDRHDPLEAAPQALRHLGGTAPQQVLAGTRPRALLPAYDGPVALPLPVRTTLSDVAGTSSWIGDHLLVGLRRCILRLVDGLLHFLVRHRGLFHVVLGDVLLGQVP